MASARRRHHSTHHSSTRRARHTVSRGGRPHTTVKHSTHHAVHRHKGKRGTTTVHVTTHARAVTRHNRSAARRRVASSSRRRRNGSGGSGFGQLPWGAAAGARSRSQPSVPVSPRATEQPFSRVFGVGVDVVVAATPGPVPVVDDRPRPGGSSASARRGLSSVKGIVKLFENDCGAVDVSCFGGQM